MKGETKIKQEERFAMMIMGNELKKNMITSTCCT